VPQTNYRIDSKLAEELSLYSSLAQVPISKCIDEAVRNWLDTVAINRLATMYEEIESRGPSATLSQAKKR
jgi:hypothetical protein